MYSDPDEQRRFMRDRYRHEYWVDDEFRAAEALRKAEWYERNRYRVREQQKIAYSKRRARASSV